MNPTSFTLQPAAAVSNGIAQSQTRASAGLLTLNGSLVSGGIATLSPARRIVITSAGNISTINFTITGTDRYGYAQTEDIVGPNATSVYTNKDFLTVTSIAVDASTGGVSLTVGTNGVMSTAWYCGDFLTGKLIEIPIHVSTGATLIYTVEYTPINLNDYTEENAANRVLIAQNAVVFPSSDPAVVAASATKATNFIFPPPGIRLTLNSYTSGAVTIYFLSPNNLTF